MTFPDKTKEAKPALTALCLQLALCLFPMRMFAQTNEPAFLRDLQAKVTISQSADDSTHKSFRITYYRVDLDGGKLINSDIQALGADYMMEDGVWQSVNEQESVIDEGRFLRIWRKTEKGWKVFRDLIKSDSYN